MNVFQYVDLMKEQNSIVATVGVGLLALFLLIIIFKMLVGMRRGTWRQLIYTASTVFSAIAAFTLAEILTNSVLGSINTDKIDEFINEIAAQAPEIAEMLKNALASIDTELIENIIVLPAALIILPFLTTILFMLINSILKIVRAILAKIFRFKKAKNNSQRLGGALLGAIQTIVWVIMITLPFTGLLSLIDQAYQKTVEADSEGTSQIQEVYEEYLAPFTYSPAFSFTNSLGSELVADRISTVRIEGQRVNIRDESISIASIVISEAPKLQDVDFTQLSPENQETIDKIVNGMCDSTYASKIMVCILQSMSAIIDSDLIPGEALGDIQPLTDGLSQFFSSISVSTLREDVNTLKSVYYLFSDNGILMDITSGEGNLIEKLQQTQENGETIVNTVINILRSNERTALLVKAITKTVISSISTKVELEDGTEVEITYDSLKDSISNVVSVKKDDYATTEEYKEAVKDTLDEELKNVGLEVEEEVLDSVADYIEENLSDIKEFDDEEFTDVMLHYYDAYLKYLETGEIPEGLPQ